MSGLPLTKVPSALYESTGIPAFRAFATGEVNAVASMTATAIPSAFAEMAVLM